MRIQIKPSIGGWIGLSSGILWGINTVWIGLILNQSTFQEFILLAPIISTFLHDTFSSIWLFLYILFTKKLKDLKQAFTSGGAKIILFSGLLGGPIGMTGYMLAIQSIGPSYTAIISATYPAIGTFISWRFLKDKISTLNIVGISIAIGATIALGLTTTNDSSATWIGFGFALLCAIGWGSESAITAYGMKKEVTPTVAIQIRQAISAITYLFIILPFIQGFHYVSIVLHSKTSILLALTALIGSASYLLYYTAIHQIGPIRAMGLNISYSAWAVVFSLLIGFPTSFFELLLAITIVSGSILSTGHPSSFFNGLKQET